MKLQQLPYKINVSTDDYYAEHNVLRSDLKLYREASDYIAEGKKRNRAVKILESLVEKYPDCPMFLNQLVGAYAEVNDETNVEIHAKKLWEKFPDFLIGRINKANDLFFKDVNPDVILESVFGGITSLEKLYPERKMFYATEVFSFHLLLAELYLEKDEFETALYHATIVRQLDPSNEDVKMLMLKIEYVKSNAITSFTLKRDSYEECNADCKCNSEEEDELEDMYIEPNEEKQSEKIVFVNNINDKK